MSGISSGPSFSFRKLMIFIDGTNFLAGCVNYRKDKKGTWGISYFELERFLINNATKHGLIRAEHIKTFYYGPKGVPELVNSLGPDAGFPAVIEAFQEDLKSNHVRLILKEKIKGKEKNIDAALVTDMLSLAYSGAYDYALLVSGDADFISAIDEVKRYGKVACAASFKSDFNEALLEHVDKFIPLDNEAIDFIKQRS